RLVAEQQAHIYDQFHQFSAVDFNITRLAGPTGEAFEHLNVDLPHNTLDFGPPGRVVKWRNTVLPAIIAYLGPASPSDRELRYDNAVSKIDIARHDILDHPTRFARRTLLPILDRWDHALRKHYEEWRP